MLVSFEVVFPKFCFTIIQLKTLNPKEKKKGLKEGQAQKLMPVCGDRMEAGSHHPFQHGSKGRLRLQCRLCVPWSAARDGNTAVLGEDQEGKCVIRCADESAGSGHVPQRPAARKDPALAVVFLGRWTMAMKQA